MFAFLVIERGPGDLVAFPDGKREAHPPGGGEAAARRWNAEHVDVLLDERQREALREAERRERRDEMRREALAASEEGVRVEYEARLAKWQRDQEDELAELAKSSTAAFGSDEGRRRSYELRNPKPTLDGVRDELYPSEASPDAPAAQALREDFPERATFSTVQDFWWARLLGVPNGDTRLLGPPGVLPRAAIAKLLGELADQGWEVVHVSEERVVAHGVEMSSATCVGMNVMLRTAASGRPSS